MAYSWLKNPVVYETDHSISQYISRIVSSGFNCELRKIENYTEDTDAIMYGILRGCSEVMKKSQEINRNYVNIDHGYFTNREKNPYFRLTRNARHYSYKLLDWPDDRFKSHNLTIKEYNTTGNDIIILPPSSFWGQYSKIDYKKWTDNVLSLLKNKTDRTVIIKEKNGVKPLSEYLKTAYVLIHYSSMGSVEALLEGIPVITLGPSFLYDYTTNTLDDIENIKLFDRQKLFNNLAYNQFNLNEIFSGVAKEILNEIYEKIDK